MRAKPLKGAFSSYFYQRLRSEGIKPRRLNKPKGPERFTVSVSSSKVPRFNNMYYDPRALKNLDRAIELLPEIRPKMERALELTLEHERVHLGASKDYPAFSARRMKEISNRGGWANKSGLAVEQVANRAIVAKILRDNRLKRLESAGAKGVVSEELCWLLIDADIRYGNLQNFIRTGTREATASQIRKRIKVVEGVLRLLFPNLPREIVRETMRRLSKTYNQLVEAAIQRASRISIV